MEIKEYLFESPYRSAVQVGRLDPSSIKETKSEQPDTKELIDLTKKGEQNPLATKSIVVGDNKIDTYV